MRKNIIFILLLLVTCVNVCAQRVSTQQFMVRKITFNSTDQIVPINGISVEINKAKFRSDKNGQFIANIPGSKDMGFFISNITAPGYIVSIPEDLSKKVFLSSNQFVIVLADINAVKAERTRIFNNNKAALAKQEERLKAEVSKNQELLSRIEKKESEYIAVVAELEKTKRQLDSFNNAKRDLEEKIDSLSDNLSLVDYASLNSEEQARIDKEKEGEWIDAIVDEVISKLETTFNTKHHKELKEFNKTITAISNEYYQTFIKDNTPLVVNYFSGHYGGYLKDKISDLRKKKDKVIDRILDKIIEEDLLDLLSAHIDSCQNKWHVKETNSTKEYTSTNSTKTLETAKEEFLKWAWYPDRETSMRAVMMKPQWQSHISSVDTDILKTIKRVYHDFYNQCKISSDQYVKEYMSLSNEDYDLFSSQDKQTSIIIDTEMAIRKGIADTTTCPYYEFSDLVVSIAADESLEPVRREYNKLVEEDVKKLDNESFVSIDNKIRHISEEKHHTSIMSWESDKGLNDSKDKYDKLKLEYPEYTSFLYSIIMQFMQPIINKYDCDEAIYTWKSSMEEDVSRYCFDPIYHYSNILSYIPDVAGSNDKCRDILYAIIDIEKEKIVINHNERIKSIKGFDKEEDIINYLATHVFINADLERSSWYDSKISKWFFRMGKIESSENISYSIMEWDKNKAKIKMTMLRGGSPFIVNIQLNSNSASYSESAGGVVNIQYTVTNK